jgi:hypothetical protein
MIYGIHKAQKTAISLSHLAAFAECATFPGSLKTSGTGSGIHPRSSQEGNASLFRKRASGCARRSLPDGSPPHLAVASQFIVDQHQTDDDLGVSVLPGGEASSRYRQTRQLNSTTPRPAEIFQRSLSRRANISTLRSCKQLSIHRILHITYTAKSGQQQLQTADSDITSAIVAIFPPAFCI